jgi:hypothetical protein
MAVFNGAGDSNPADQIAGRDNGRYGGNNLRVDRQGGRERSEVVSRPPTLCGR